MSKTDSWFLQKDNYYGRRIGSEKMDVTSVDNFLLVLLWNGKRELVAKRRYGIKGNYLIQSPHGCKCDLNEKVIIVQIYVLFKSRYSKRRSQGHRFNLNCN